MTVTEALNDSDSLGFLLKMQIRKLCIKNGLKESQVYPMFVEACGNDKLNDSRDLIKAEQSLALFTTAVALALKRFPANDLGQYIDS